MRVGTVAVRPGQRSSILPAAMAARYDKSRAVCCPVACVRQFAILPPQRCHNYRVPVTLVSMAVDLGVSRGERLRRRTDRRTARNKRFCRAQ